jgi:hypothetical protein
VHMKVEYRLRHDANKGLLFFSDFYTENPAVHRAAYDWTKVMVANTGGLVLGDTRRIHLEVKSGANSDAAPKDVTDPSGKFADFRQLAISPNPDTLQAAADKKSWWAKHRPLVLQTSCLGPIDFNQRTQLDEDKENIKPHVPLRGIRLLKVNDNVLTEIHYLDIEEIKKVIAAPVKRKPTDRDVQVDDDQKVLG